MVAGHKTDPAAVQPNWLQGGVGNWQLVVHAQPGARKSAVVGQHGDALKIRIGAPAVDGKANTELMRFLSHLIGVPVRDLSLLAGASGRSKRIGVACQFEAQEMLSRLTPDA